MIIGFSVLTLYMLHGTNWRLLVRTLIPGLLLIGVGIASEPFRRARFTAFIDPWADPTGNGYQLIQALLAIGSGGFFGVGLGHSVQKVHFLPEAHTDMIFAIVVEELGLVGVTLVIGCFLALAMVGTKIAMQADTRFHGLVAAGLTAVLCGQAALNLAGVVGMLPLTGIPLPLVSYGGTNLLITLVSLGLLANIATAHSGGVRRHAAG
jgi:cell division protein FtsW